MDTAVTSEAHLVQSLREGDEEAFSTIVTRFHQGLLRAAVSYVRDSAAAEDVVQETWVGFLHSLDRFEGSCTLKTWLFRILFNKAQTRVKKDRRLVPFSTLVAEEMSSPRRAVDASSFHRDGRLTGHWLDRPPAWKTDPEQMLLDKEALTIVSRAIDELPPAQRSVVLMSDVNGLPADEVCAALGISPGNRRVLLHRARAYLREALSAEYSEVG